MHYEIINCSAVGLGLGIEAPVIFVPTATCTGTWGSTHVDHEVRPGQALVSKVYEEQELWEGVSTRNRVFAQWICTR